MLNELSLIEEMLLNDLRVKMSYKLQKMLTIKCYRAIDIYEFARLCLHIDQILRDVESKSLENADYRRIADAIILSFVNKSEFESSTATDTTKSTICQ
jgi:hypothetical protein